MSSKKKKLKQLKQIRRAIARRKKISQNLQSNNKSMKISTVSNFMKFDIQLDMLLAGYSMSACKPGQPVRIVQREFISSEDGDLFISRLEGFPSELLDKIAKKYNTIIRPSAIDCMLAILGRDKTATIYINPTLIGNIRTKRTLIKAGEVIYSNDIADVCELRFKDIQIPDDSGIIVLFSVNWRKGLFYDFSLLGNTSQKKDYDLNQLLGGYYAYLSLHNRFKISDSEWQSLLQNGWFPFITLDNNLIDEIINHNREHWNIDDLLPKIKTNVLKRLPDGLKSWANIKTFIPHIDFISKAIEHYQKDDFISCISVLFPRIEGIMCQFQCIQGQSQRISQKDLANTVLSPNVNPKSHLFSPLLPLRFNQYLSEVYFANFDPLRADNALSRNSVSHGIATTENFTLKGSTLGFLILDQLSYYFHGKK